MSESMPVCATDLDYAVIECDTPETVGKPLGRSARVVKPTEDLEDGEKQKALPFGKIGELQLKGPGVMKGYIQDMKSERDIDWESEQWFSTGDLCTMDKQGNVRDHTQRPCTATAGPSGAHHMWQGPRAQLLQQSQMRRFTPYDLTHERQWPAGC